MIKETELCEKCKKPISDWSIAKENLWGELQFYHPGCIHIHNLFLPKDNRIEIRV